ncbi:MAG: Zn-dependent hydrolase [Carbonactinosporaceae bacterium]
MSYPDALAVDPATMQAYVETLGRLGATTSGGVTRTQYDPAWVAARDTVAAWFAEAGLEVRTDAVGNVFGRLAGTEPSGTVLTGSHLDSVVNGGRYDGALGIHAGLAALRALQDACGPPRRALEVVAFCEEENSRFHANYFGSRALLGLVSPDEPERLTDADGVTLAEAMRTIGLDPARCADAARTDIESFVEMHIEQGRILADEGLQLGVVTAIVGLSWQIFTVTGRQDHAGTTPMHLRHDALQGAALMTTAVREATERVGRPAVATTGRFDVRPGGGNIVPREVEFTLDLRHPDDDTRRALLAEIEDACRRVATERGLDLAIETAWDESAARMDADLRRLIADTAAASGHTCQEMPSGAGHDSQVMSRQLPTAMLFVPSVEGRSHCPEEYTPPEDCARGATVLARTLHRLAY